MYEKCEAIKEKTTVEKIVELVRELNSGEVKGLEEALYRRRLHLESEFKDTFKAINFPTKG